MTAENAPPLTFAPGEEAVMQHDGAVIRSRGPLPFHLPNTEALHTKADFPGTPVRLGERLFEVRSQITTGDTWEYMLSPWKDECIARGLVNYTPEFIAQIQKERQTRVFQRRAKPVAWLLSPILGALPEEQQYLQCDRFGIAAERATMFSGLLEGGFWIWLFLVTVRAAGDGTQPAHTGVALLIPVYAFLAALGFFRVLGAVMFNDPSGFWLLNFGFRLAAGMKPMMERLDMTAVPLTRAGFWARLRIPDRHQREEDGALVVESPLCHLTWEDNGRVSIGGLVALVEVLPPEPRQNQLWYRYRLRPMRDQGEVPAPDTQMYQKNVRDSIVGEWDALIESFPVFLCMLPTDVQVRAVGARGGPKVWGKWTLITSLIEIAPFSVKVAALILGDAEMTGIALYSIMFVDGLFRLLRWLGGQYAPSLFGYLFKDWLPAERKAFHAHLAAERQAVKALKKQA